MAGTVGWQGVCRVLCVVAFCVAALPSVTAQAAPSGSVNEDAVAVIIGNTNYTGDRIPNVDYAHRDACFSGDSPKGMLIEATSGITMTPVLREKSVNMVILTAASGT